MKILKNAAHLPARTVFFSAFEEGLFVNAKRNCV